MSHGHAAAFRATRRTTFEHAPLWLRYGAVRSLHRADGSQVVRSCVKPMGSVGRASITTLEGLGTPEKPHPIQRAFIEEGAAQCGYCLSGVILTAKALLDANPNASDQEIREALGGVLCRCFAHIRMLRAIRRYADTRRSS